MVSVIETLECFGTEISQVIDGNVGEQLLEVVNPFCVHCLWNNY